MPPRGLPPACSALLFKGPVQPIAAGIHGIHGILARVARIPRILYESGSHASSTRADPADPLRERIPRILARHTASSPALLACADPRAARARVVGAARPLVLVGSPIPPRVVGAARASSLPGSPIPRRRSRSAQRLAWRSRSTPSPRASLAQPRGSSLPLGSQSSDSKAASVSRHDSLQAPPLRLRSSAPPLRLQKSKAPKQLPQSRPRILSELDKLLGYSLIFCNSQFHKITR